MSVTSSERAVTSEVGGGWWESHSLSTASFPQFGLHSVRKIWHQKEEDDVGGGRGRLPSLLHSGCQPLPWGALEGNELFVWVFVTETFANHLWFFKNPGTTCEPFLEITYVHLCYQKIKGLCISIYNTWVRAGSWNWDVSLWWSSRWNKLFHLWLLAFGPDIFFLFAPPAVLVDRWSVTRNSQALPSWMLTWKIFWGGFRNYGLKWCCLRPSFITVSNIPMSESVPLLPEIFRPECL